MPGGGPDARGRAGTLQLVETGSAGLKDLRGSHVSATKNNQQCASVQDMNANTCQDSPHHLMVVCRGWHRLHIHPPTTGTTISDVTNSHCSHQLQVTKK